MKNGEGAQLVMPVGRDFTVLNMTDIQFNDIFDLFGRRNLTVRTIEKLVEQVRPDLITLTGDQVWAMRVRGSVRYLCHMLEAFNIPWAPVFGNHDAEGNASKQYFEARFRRCKNCLYERGPAELFGRGNYSLDIVKDDQDKKKIVHTLFFFDSGARNEYVIRNEEGVRESVTRYDMIKYNQIKWYKDTLKGIKEREGYMPTSSVFLHIPLLQYRFAYDLWRQGGFNPSVGFGENNEQVSCPPVDNGFFTMIKALGSTKNVFAGHDHTNCASILYEGVRLTYALKTGDRCYWKEGLSGGTKMTVSSDGNTQVEHVYIRP